MIKKSQAFALVMLFMLPTLLSAQAKNDRLAGSQKRPGVTSELDYAIVKSRIELYVLEKYQGHHDDVVLEHAKRTESIIVNPLDWDIKVATRNGVVKRGSNLVTVTVFSKEQVYKQFIANLKLRTYDDVVVAKRRVDKRQKLTSDDLAIERVESTSFRRDYFVDIKDLLDLQTKRMLAEGKPILAEAVELPDLIRRGDLIKILVRVKNLEVTATGKALENGRLGDDIKVENLTTGKKITGQIQDKKTIVVEL